MLEIIKRARRQQRKKKDKEDEDGDGEDPMDDDDEEYRPTAKRPVEDEDSDEESGPDPNNPLPGFVDPITLTEVVKPAISPYGHVMSYSTWSRCLTQQPICPITKNPLKKRELVLLTWDNIEDFKSKIIWDSTKQTPHTPPSAAEQTTEV